MIKVSLAIFLLMSCSISVAEIKLKRQRELAHLVKHDCGSCHGMTLKGGLGPALRKVDLKDKSDQQLFDTIYYGREANAMPPWKAILTKEEIRWVIKFLRKQK